MAVRSWPPSSARTIRPPAKPISCFVRYPKPARGNGRCKRRARAGREPMSGRRSKRPETHYITLQRPRGPALRNLMEARSAWNTVIEESQFGILFDLFESRNYGLGALIL